MCDICGQKLASHETSYKIHLKYAHGGLSLNIKPKVVYASDIRPVRVTGRSVSQIVHDQEKVWGAAIFPRVHPWQSLEAI
jgi:hypothetical protein